jgi:myo-inositol 2-dehydrogenase/D-chiro-inositol 1-dehydrogenase
MKLALLGVDPAMLSVARAARERGHELVAAVDAGMAADFLRGLWPQVQLVDDWEALLAPGGVEAVLVAHSPREELLSDQLRKLVQEGVPLLIAHPLPISMLVYYELEMIRRETGCRLLPYLPDRWHPAMAQLIGLLDDSHNGLGRLEQASIERFLAERDREGVTRQFAADVDLVRVLAGELTHVSALAPGDALARYANLGVQLSGPRNVAVRWTARPAEPQQGARLSLLCSSGRAELLIPAEGDWTLDVWRNKEKTSQRYTTWDPAAAAVERLEQMVAGQQPSPSWVDACRAVELSETIDRSLAKGRTIELHLEDHSEQATFKGTMTSLGCGLLVVALLIMLAAAVAARMGLPLARHWATALVVLLGLFLALQALRLVFPAKEPDVGSP